MNVAYYPIKCLFYFPNQNIWTSQTTRESYREGYPVFSCMEADFTVYAMYVV